MSRVREYRGLSFGRTFDPARFHTELSHPFRYGNPMSAVPYFDGDPLVNGNWIVASKPRKRVPGALHAAKHFAARTARALERWPVYRRGSGGNPDADTPVPIVHRLHGA